jgi:hypothetical protein
VLGAKAFDRRPVFKTLVGVAGKKCLSHPGQHFVVEAQAAEQLGELPFQLLLAHVIAAADGRVSLALIGVAGAVIVDVALLLDLADHRAAALAASDQTRESEVVRHAAVLLDKAAIHHTLHPLP